MAERRVAKGDHLGESTRRRRLLSPQDAATYLGLGSRWAIRRLVTNGELPVVKFAGKWRLDLEDLDRFVTERKTVVAGDEPFASNAPPSYRARQFRSMPRAGLAPSPHRRRQVGDSSVTAPSQVLDRSVAKERAMDSQSGACPRTDTR